MMQITYASKTIQRLCEQGKHQLASTTEMQSKPCESVNSPIIAKSGKKP
jgi:hypothetical protein